MFFTGGKSSVYHILANRREGTAPAPCGMRLARYDRIMLQRGAPTSHVLKEKPPEAPLCKHCEKSRGGGF
jgi:hypothetical protein